MTACSAITRTWVLSIRFLTRKLSNGSAKGNIAIGHVRYSTTGNCNASNAQPLVVRHIKGPMAIAHNGNLTNAKRT